MNAIKALILLLVVLTLSRDIPYLNFIVVQNTLFIYSIILYLLLIPLPIVTLFSIAAIMMVVLAGIAAYIELIRLTELFGIAFYMIVLGLFIKTVLYGKTFSNK